MVCDLLQKIELLHSAGTEMNPPHGQEIVRTFYDILTVLDTKGLALLAFDGIVVAATTFAAERGGVFHNRGWPRWLAILINILSNSLVVFDYRNPIVLRYVLAITKLEK